MLDKLLGEDHGTVYKKSGLKTLVTLHKSLGAVSDRLNQDEVTIISAVLDLKEKPVESVMTPMEDVFVMSDDTVLDERTMDMILSAGYSRIPIHESGKPNNFVGMLLVKILITYDPEDCSRVRDFPLATLPETRPETSCLDIVNFFQEGKSRMVLVSEYPGEDRGAMGCRHPGGCHRGVDRRVSLTMTMRIALPKAVTKIRRREIIDESDMYIDVHKAIRRLAPAPKAKFRLSSEDFGKSDDTTVVGGDAEDGNGHKIQRRSIASVGALPSEAQMLSTSPKATTFMMRRTSIDGQAVKLAIPVRANIDEMREHLKHLGPSNPATNPKGTRSTTVKIKPGIPPNSPGQQRAGSAIAEVIEGLAQDATDETTSLLRPALTGKDGVQALRQSYGSTAGSEIPAVDHPHTDSAKPFVTPETVSDQLEQIDQGTQTSSSRPASPTSRLRLPGLVAARAAGKRAASWYEGTTCAAEASLRAWSNPWGAQGRFWRRQARRATMVSESWLVEAHRAQWRPSRRQGQN